MPLPLHHDFMLRLLAIKKGLVQQCCRRGRERRRACKLKGCQRGPLEHENLLSHDDDLRQFNAVSEFRR